MLCIVDSVSDKEEGSSVFVSIPYRRLITGFWSISVRLVIFFSPRVYESSLLTDVVNFHVRKEIF